MTNSLSDLERPSHQRERAIELTQIAGPSRLQTERAATTLRTAVALAVMLLARPAAATQQGAATYLPDARASRIVSVTKAGDAAAGVTVLTEAVAINETGPKETVARFGEVYRFAPALIVVRRDEPTRISIWNLQPDDEHDFMLADPRNNVLMHVLLPPLQETAHVFTFHQEGLFTFYCTLHQPAMTGQILVVPPGRR